MYGVKGGSNKVIELMREERGLLRPLWEGNDSVLLKACLEGNMGRAWVDSKEDPTLAILLVADFCYLFGAIKSIEDENKVKDLLDNCKRRIIVTDDSSWISILEKYYPNTFRRFKRYSIKREPNVFGREVLEGYIKAVEGTYTIDRIDESLYFKVLEDPFMADCCSNYSSLEHFLEDGLGYMIVDNGEIVAGASSYCYCQGHIDITIGTKEAFRQKGLALACASKLILECLENNIYPVWDAVDLRSIALAEKLGYNFNQEYEVYAI